MAFIEEPTFVGMGAINAADPMNHSHLPGAIIPVPPPDKQDDPPTLKDRVSYLEAQVQGLFAANHQLMKLIKRLEEHADYVKGQSWRTDLVDWGSAGNTRPARWGERTGTGTDAYGSGHLDQSSLHGQRDQTSTTQQRHFGMDLEPQDTSRGLEALQIGRAHV